jgi:hypothetical protein
MGGRTVASWERFPGNNERGRVGTKVLEEIRETVEDDETVPRSFGAVY